MVLLYLRRVLTSANTFYGGLISRDCLELKPELSSETINMLSDPKVAEVHMALQ